MSRRTVVIIASLFVLGAAAVPVVAFVVVPQLVRSTLVETAPAEGAVTLRSGELVRISAADYGTGTVRIAQTDTGKVLRFENVDIAGAPDVYVYLSDRSDGQPGTFIDLGRLKATNGSFNYAIPTSADLGVVRSVVVWCRQFNVTITYATLH
ncbi:MAG: DM13 domain-containing protein [Chloroflexota bacterium]|nr:DM13 domain-containing protein [Chloroflexota bacterium]